MMFKVTLPVTGFVEVSIEASGRREAKVKALQIGRAFMESLDGKDESIEEWRAGIPNRRDIVIEEVVRLCGGALESKGSRTICGKCGAKAPQSTRSATCTRPVRPRN